MYNSYENIYGNISLCETGFVHNTRNGQEIISSIKRANKATIKTISTNNCPPSIHHWQLRDTLRVWRNDEEHQTNMFWISGQGVVRQKIDDISHLPSGTQLYKPLSYTPTCIDVNNDSICTGGQMGEISVMPIEDRTGYVSIPAPTHNTVNHLKFMNQKVYSVANDGILRRINLPTLQDSPVSLGIPSNNFCISSWYMTKQLQLGTIVQSDAHYGTIFLVGDDNMLTILHEDDDSLQRIKICSTCGTTIETQGSVAIDTLLQNLCIGTQTGCIILYDLRWMEKPLISQKICLYRGRMVTTASAIRTINFVDPYNIIMTHHKEYITRLNIHGLRWRRTDLYSTKNLGNSYSCPYAESIQLPDVNDISGIGLIGEEGAVVSSTRKFVFFPYNNDYVRSICL